MRRVLILLVLLCLIGPKTAFPAKQSGKLAVKSALVTEYSSGKTLYSQDADRRIPPASLTKVMTMYLVFDLVASGKASFSDRIKISRRADATGGSTMNLHAGEVVTLDELMRGMAVASGNDACIAVAEHFGGIPHFVEMMNSKARSLGMTGTTFKNPNGLPAPGQLTTARDLTKLAVSYLHHYPQALRYHSTTEISHNGAVHGNTNRLLGTCDGVDGIKTGYIDASGYNIIATAKRGDARVIAVVLGGRTKQLRNREATRILDASFSGAVDSMVASCDVPEPTPTKIVSKRSRSKHHGKVVRIADSERRSSVSSRRGASARFDAHAVSAKSKHTKSAKANKAGAPHTTSHSQSKKHAKNGAASR
ncbi:D-alanyl-D-alanine carboxypeptidase family protein [Desulfovibrio sp. TomC]|uniref:D-alanyl-D-alanine carboxypeptidase family protein n=1 Tax=Desulfovibrio sp. TomC TaxID=1562888 RepID=UPI00057356A3|nr:D-alanyl-D-alanine carboxypeptidase family protein [Desulfovibrio sp. TomC]KHK01560.1 D-alanyl-D-alanine carboxypeptidase [Desulfovibrio sp. TomC]